MESVLIFCGILAVIAAATTISLFLEKKRRQELSDFALKNGYQFSAAGEHAPGYMLAAQCLKRGNSRKMTNFLRKTGISGEHLVFDYWYRQGSGKNSHSYSQSVYASRCEDLPDFEMCPENFLHRAAEFFGYQDIDFENNRAFSSKYLLRSSNPSAVKDCFDPRVLKFFEEQPGWSVESHGGWLYIFRENRKESVKNLPEFLNACQKAQNVLCQRR